MMAIENVPICLGAAGVKRNPEKGPYTCRWLKCFHCGFYPPEAERRKTLPLETDPATGLRRMYVGEKKEDERDGA